MLDFIEMVNEKKFAWKWDIYLNKTNKILSYPNLNIDINKDNHIIVTPSNELLLKSYLYEDKVRKGYLCCDIMFKKIDYNEICFYNSFYDFISFIIKSFYDKFDKCLNKNVLKFINPLDDNKIKTYIAKYKITNKILTNFININTLEKEIICNLPLILYIYPKLMFKNIHIINKCIYIDIIITTCFIYPTIKNNVKTIKEKEEKGIMKLPKELLINIMEILFENDDNLENLIFTSKYFFYLFINNYKILHEKWIISSNINKNRFNNIEWKYQKIKSILNY